MPNCALKSESSKYQQFSVQSGMCWIEELIRTSWNELLYLKVIICYYPLISYNFLRNLCNNLGEKIKPVMHQKYCILSQMFCLLFAIIGEILQTLGTWSLASNMPSTWTTSRARNSAECPWSTDIIRGWQTVFASYKQKYENFMRILRVLDISYLSCGFARKKPICLHFLVWFLTNRLQTCCMEGICSCCTTLWKASRVPCKLWQST